MKKVIQVTEVDGEGLEALLDKNILLFCLNYIYTGKLIGVNKTCVLLSNPRIVYETGELDSKIFKDAQKFPHEIYIQIGAIESFSQTDKV